MTIENHLHHFGHLEIVEARSGDNWNTIDRSLGKKGSRLADMSRMGIPVPPGFILTEIAASSYLENNRQLPGELWSQVLEAVQGIEDATGRKFGDSTNPMLLSCRPAGKALAPIATKAILNIGLNDEIAEGMISETYDRRFVYDSYRRLIQMFGTAVFGVPSELFESVIADWRRSNGLKSDIDLSGRDWQNITRKLKEIVLSYSNVEFPSDPYKQLSLAIKTAFDSWNDKRAIEFRSATGAFDSLGMPVIIQFMVFGNAGSDSVSGIAMSRSALTGEPVLEGAFLVNAQGEDVVAGHRDPQRLEDLRKERPKLYTELETIARKMEARYRTMQDMEFTIEGNKLWILQSRDGKRTLQAEIKMAVDMAEEALITREDAVKRIKSEQIAFLLHPQLDTRFGTELDCLIRGLSVSPGAAVGVVAFSAETAEFWANKEGKKVILVRPETKPEDVNGILASQGVLTGRGGRTSHATLVARQFGKPIVVGAFELEIYQDEPRMVVGDRIVREGDWLSLDGTQGLVYVGQLPTTVTGIENRYLTIILGWADEFRALEVWGNADNPRDARRARDYGAQGLGLCRTEHMFFETDRLPLVQQVIMSKSPIERSKALARLLPLHRKDFEEIFRVMDGLPVVIRLIDPPFHEFLPDERLLQQELTDLRGRLQQIQPPTDITYLESEIRFKQSLLDKVIDLHEVNPMLGTRGVRLGILAPDVTRMQVRAIFEAACACVERGIDVYPSVMVPLTMHVNELKIQQHLTREVAREVMVECGIDVEYKFGTMIELPRAALTADELAEFAQFISFGTNDLTQTTYGISRDDAESSFLVAYMREGILPENPFTSIDPIAVGQLIAIAVERGRKARPDLVAGTCGEHAGDPKSIALFHRLGLNYVSCSPFRVPAARLAAAHAVLELTAS